MEQERKEAPNPQKLICDNYFRPFFDDSELSNIFFTKTSFVETDVQNYSLENYKVQKSHDLIEMIRKYIDKGNNVIIHERNFVEWALDNADYSSYTIEGEKPDDMKDGLRLVPIDSGENILSDNVKDVCPY